MSAPLVLEPIDKAMLAGEQGPARQLAMRLVMSVASALGAPRLVYVTQAHLTSCFYTGRASLDFARRLVQLNAEFAVPTTTNAATPAGCLARRGRLDLLAEPHRAAQATSDGSELMDCYERLGARPSFTCAPYQLPSRPGLGEDIAWAESNAVIFANSVLGARTNKYGEFLDVAAALTGRAPFTGMHDPAQRRGTLLFTVDDVGAEVLSTTVAYHALGLIVGERTGTRVPVIAGLPPAITEDRLRAVGAIASMPGNTVLFHAVGSTPEAPTVAAALGGREPQEAARITLEDLRSAAQRLSTAGSERLTTVALGTPHFSLVEFEELLALLSGRHVAPGIEMLVSTGQHVYDELERRGSLTTLVDAGATLIVDTCTYIPGILDDKPGVVMTNAAKWAYRAPDTIRMKVLFASTEECVESAVAGAVSLAGDAWWR
jgi:predicted aconitase